MKQRILIFAKTHPEPSSKYTETVCTGGVLEDGSFVRLFPITFRHLPKEKRFKRYQWIEADIEKSDKDNRKESYRINQDSIKIVSPPLTTENGWALRREIVLKKCAKSLEDLGNQQEQDGTSLGIIRPMQVRRFYIREDTKSIDEKYTQLKKQGDLFRCELAPLQKLPFKFTYEFKCDDPTCKGHNLMVSDWEIFALYHNCRDKCRSDKEAIDMVKKKVFYQLCSDKYDMHFYVGTHRRWKSWMIVGLFYPPKPKPDPNLGIFDKE